MFWINKKQVSEAKYRAVEQQLKSSGTVLGVYETMRCIDGSIPLLDFHVARIQTALDQLSYKYVISNTMREDLAVYSLPESAIIKYQLGLVNSEHAVQRLLEIREYDQYPKSYWSDGISLALCAERMPVNVNQLGRKLIQRDFYNACAVDYQQQDCVEGLILNDLDELVEGSRTNLFIIKNTNLITPDLSNGGVAGPVYRVFNWLSLMR